MSYRELDGDRWIFAVAQKPFWASGNEFCTLAPVISEDGRRSKPELFPNSGLVWWLVRSGSRNLAQPGRLVVATLEEPLVYEPDDRTKHLYQVDADRITPAGSRDALEILTVIDPRVKRPEDLVDSPGIIQVDHHPTDSVWVRLGAAIYGPFKPKVEALSDTRFDVVFTLPPNNPIVYRVAESDLGTLGDGYCRGISIGISQNASPRYDVVPHNISYELVVGGATERLYDLGQQIALETDDRVIARAAKQVGFVRSRRQELTALLGEFENLVSATAEVADAAVVVQAIQRRLKINSQAVDELVKRIFQTGVLDKKLEERLDEVVREEVEKQASYLMAEAEEKSAEAQKRLHALRAELQREVDELNRRRRDADEELRKEMEARRQELEQGWREREERLAESEAHLEERETRLRSALETAADRLQHQRGEVITDVLTVLPLLSGMPTAQVASQQPPATPTHVPHESATFELPPFIHGERSKEYRTPLREQEFFERFAQRVRDEGFAYDDDDLIAFHLSVKSSDLTLLSGVSGTGKSSLPRFYMDALQGEAATELDGEVGRYLHVAVRPSWLDQQDLIGHVNTLDREFVPSESGLFPLLAAAAEEYQRRGSDSGLYLICLDEMNLAQVEHYFGSFLSALERPLNDRRISCFSPASVSTRSPFRTWSQMHLSPSLRFIGTVNYDETTRSLSQRFLDRTNEIELAVQDFHTLRVADQGRKSPPVAVPGRAVTMSDVRAWVSEDALAPKLAAMLDAIREPLRKMRRPLTPRRHAALTRFVASAAGLADRCSPEKAFDLQLSMRLVPQFRNLSSPSARDGLDELLQAFEAEGYDDQLPRTWAALQRVDEDLRPILEIA